MRTVIQRVKNASVSVDGKTISSIGPGLLVLLGVEPADTQEDIEWLAGKINRLRIFADDNGAMNWSIHEIDGEFLVVSQFTLFANTRKGNRPSFLEAAPPDLAEKRYEEFCLQLERESGRNVGRGVFGAHMEISLVNDGPVTIWIDSKKRA
jgi:D-tyrosyl-tRNA(Tyr) deacylase